MGHWKEKEIERRFGSDNLERCQRCNKILDEDEQDEVVCSDCIEEATYD